MENRPGLLRPPSHRIIPCEDCLSQPESFSRAAAAFREWADAYGESIYNEKEHSGKLRHLYLRQAASDGGVMACVVANGRSLGQEEALIETMRRRVPELKSLLLNCNQADTNVVLGKETGCSGGKKPFPIPCAALLSSISPLSFIPGEPQPDRKALCPGGGAGGLTGEETLLDLYCGRGPSGSPWPTR